jgi:hypothetical protein
VPASHFRIEHDASVLKSICEPSALLGEFGLKLVLKRADVGNDTVDIEVHSPA